jgi:hypothetical protein
MTQVVSGVCHSPACDTFFGDDSHTQLCSDLKRPLNPQCINVYSA